MAREALGLPEKERAELFEQLRTDLGLAVAPNRVDEINEKMAQALRVFDRVIEYLGLDEDGVLALKMKEFDAVPSDIREDWRAARIAKAYLGSWPMAKKAASGGSPSTSPSQVWHRQNLVRHERRTERYLTGLNKWFDTEPDSLTLASFERWRKEHNAALSADERKITSGRQLIDRFGKTWAEVVAEAQTGTLTAATPTKDERDSFSAERSEDETETVHPRDVEIAKPSELVHDSKLIARRMAQGRQAFGWNMREAANATDSKISHSSISNIEGGRRREVSAFLLAELAKAFGVSTDYFFTDDGGEGLPKKRRARRSSVRGRTKKRD